jgi:quercetin dioxygenase-like cupin family protein
MDKVTLIDEAQALTEFWSQKVIATGNGQLFKVAKGLGSTTWHSHDDQDEVFLILRGQLRVQLRDRDVILDPGDLFVVPRGAEHCPVADEETHFLIIGTNITSNAAGGKPEWSHDGGTPSDARADRPPLPR